MGNNLYYNRLKELWESMNYIDANMFANQLGWDRAEKILRLDRQGHENEKPGISVIIDIANKFPDFDFKYLLTGIRKAYADNEPDRAEEPAVTTYGCTDCILKQKRITELEEQLKDKTELLEFYRGKKETGPENNPQLGENTNGSKAG